MPSEPEKKVEASLKSAFRRIFSSKFRPKTSRFAFVTSLYQWLLLILTACIVTYILQPEISSQQCPTDQNLIGTFSTVNVKANRDYDIVDEETTEKKRVEAEDAVRSIYDFNPEVEIRTKERIEKAFILMRDVRKRYIETYGSQETIKKKETKAKPQQKPPPGEPEKEQPDLSQLYDFKRLEFVRELQVSLTDAEFEDLKRENFSEELASALDALVGAVLKMRVVNDTRLLLSEVGKGITIRIQPDYDLKKEETFKDAADFKRITDVKDAHRIISEQSPLVLKNSAPASRSTIEEIAKRMAAPNLNFNQGETELRKTAAREHLKPVIIPIKKGETIIRDGERIEPRHILIFKGIKNQSKEINLVAVTIGIAIFFFLVTMVTYRFARRNIRKFMLGALDLAFLALILCGGLFLTKLTIIVFGAAADKFGRIPLSAYHFAIPIAAGPMLVRLVLNSEISIVFAIVLCTLTGLQIDSSFSLSIYYLLGSLVAASEVAQALMRTTLLRAGVITGIVNAAMITAVALLSGNVIDFGLLWECMFGLLGGILASMIVTAATPAFEVIFGYTTDIKLLELLNLNHPLLKELILQAPGTYHHSMVVGSLVEASASKIHSNPLLARVAAYYHDIGKVRNPQYFAENVRGPHSKHDKLAPSMSALILKSHVKDGVELARANGLGRRIIDVIQQHHGTNLIYFFYQRAKDLEQAKNGSPVEENEYRYQGPKPQFREAALVMLADCVEAAAKSLPDPTPVRLQQVVQRIINRLFTDGQLNECELTLKDLNSVAKDFNKILAGIYHRRPDYPEMRDQRGQRSEQAELNDARKQNAGKNLDVPVVSVDIATESYDEDSENLKRLGLS